MTNEDVGRRLSNAEPDLPWSSARSHGAAGETVQGVGLEAFYKAEFKQLVRFVMRCTGSTDIYEARDAVQNAFMLILPCWQYISHPRAWIRKVAVREFYKRPAAEPVERVPDRTGIDNAADATERRRQERLVTATLQALPYKQREALAWTYDGFKPREIAEILDCDPDAVRQNLAKARRKLKALGGQKEEES